MSFKLFCVVVKNVLICLPCTTLVKAGKLMCLMLLKLGVKQDLEFALKSLLDTLEELNKKFAY